MKHIATLEDQCCDEATLRQLREEWNIVFMTNGDGGYPGHDFRKMGNSSRHRRRRDNTVRQKIWAT